MANSEETTIESDLLVIQGAAKVIAKEEDPGPAILSILRMMSQLLGLNRGRVILPDNEAINSNLKIKYSYGLTADEIYRGSYQSGEGVTGKVFKTGQVALIQDIDDEPLYISRSVSRSTLPNESVSYIAVPIYTEEKTVGVLAAHRLRNRQREFQRDVALLQVIATFIGQSLRVQSLIISKTKTLQTENKLLKQRLTGRGIKYGIIGESKVLIEALDKAMQVADTSTTVLLLGESGTGKERFANMQHLASKRSDGPFVSINCAAIPESLIESELFGHEKGSFTGASVMKRGKLELASGGTLFLDEIGDLDFDLQGKLLKVLEEKVIQRVGGTKNIPIDVRIVAATHKDLHKAVRADQFRLDLFYRLNVYPIKLPPLRERGADISLLTQFFVEHANAEYERNVKISNEALSVLEKYSWPGNIRQLENLVKRSVLLSPNGEVDVEIINSILKDESGDGVLEVTNTLPEFPLATDLNESSSEVRHSSLRPYLKVSEDEAESLLEALSVSKGNKTRAALLMGMTPRQYRYRLQKLKLI